MRRAVLFSLLSSAAALVACAVTTAESDPGAPEGSIVPDASAPEATTPDVTEGLDAACDPADPNCVTKPITCAEAAWCPVPTGVSSLYVLTSVWGSSATDVWAGGSGGTVVHWDGAAWVAANIPGKNTFHNIVGSSANDVWAISATDTIYHSVGWANGTTEWVKAPSPLEEWATAPVYSAWAGLGGELRLGTTEFNLFDSEGNFGPGNQFTKTIVDGGQGWQGWPGTATINAIWGTSADDLWVAGDNSNWVKWQLGLTMHGRRDADAGPGELTWTEVDSQASVILFSIWGSSASDVWAVGDKGTIRHIGNANAERWDVVASPTKELLRAVWGSGPSDVWAVGDNGAIIHWDGKEWKESVAAFQVNKKKPDLHGVWGSGPNDVWIVGDGVALHHTGGAK